MNEHTPGPWEVLDADSYAGEPALAVAATEDAGGRPVCLCSHGAYMPRTPEDDANAHLIAAAPELLAACKDILGFLKAEGFDVRIVKAAIAKATP